MSNNSKYLIVGVCNTIFGYFSGVIIYKLCVEVLNIIWIGVLINTLNITTSYVAYKLFVFKTIGNWTQELIKYFFACGMIAVLGILLLWFFKNYLSISIEFSQGFILLISATISFVFNKKYTFNGKGNFNK